VPRTAGACSGPTLGCSDTSAANPRFFGSHSDRTFSWAVPDHAQLTAEELQQAIEDDQAGKLGVIPVNSLLCRHACRDSSVRGSGGRGRRGQPKPAHDLQADFGIDPAGLVRRWMGAVPCWQWPRRHGSRRLVRC
jgi:hypothetical protein